MHREETYPQSVISLSEEELYVILSLLQAPMIAGVDLSGFQSDSNGHRAESVTGALNAAFKSLAARGYLLPLQEKSEQPLVLAPSQESRSQPWTHTSLPQEVQVPVGVCAFATSSLLLSWHIASGRDLLYVHERDGLFVVITGLLPGIYTFTALTSWEAVWQMIANKLTIQEQAPSGLPLPSIRLRHETLTELQEHASRPEEEQREFYTRLMQAGLSSSAAQAMLETFKQVLIVASIQRLEKTQEASSQTNGKPPHRTALIITERCYLAAEPQDDAGETLLIHQASALEIEAIVYSLWSKATV